MGDRWKIHQHRGGKLVRTQRVKLLIPGRSDTNRLLAECAVWLSGPEGAGIKSGDALVFEKVERRSRQ